MWPLLVQGRMWPSFRGECDPRPCTNAGFAACSLAMSTNSLSYATGSVENEGTPPDLVDLHFCVLSLEWWRSDAHEDPGRHFGPGSATDDRRAAYVKAWCNVSSPSWCFQVEAWQDLARARDCGQGRSVDIHVLLNRFVCCMVLCAENDVKCRSYMSIGRGDPNRRHLTYRVPAQTPGKPSQIEVSS